MERSGLGRPEENNCQIIWASPERKILNIMVFGGPRFLAPEIDLKFVTRLALLQGKRRRAPKCGERVCEDVGGICTLLAWERARAGAFVRTWELSAPFQLLLLISENDFLKDDIKREEIIANGPGNTCFVQWL